MGDRPTETDTCSVHSKKRSVDHLVDDGAGGKKCGPGESECNKGPKNRGNSNCQWCQKGECWTHGGKGGGGKGGWGGGDAGMMAAMMQMFSGKGFGGGGGGGGAFSGTCHSCGKEGHRSKDCPGGGGGKGGGGFSGACHSCGQQGHRANECPSGGGGGGKGGGGFSGACHNCGQQGHRANDCPSGGGGGKGGGSRLKDKSVTIWVGNIPDGISQEEIAENFKQAGTVVKCNLTKGRTGIIQYSTSDEATAAITMFNGSMVNGSALHVDSWTGKDA